MARNHLTPYRGGEVTRGADPFMSLHRQMNRLFDDVFRGFAMPAIERSAGEQGSMALQPEIDVSETDKAYKVCADLPGVSEQDLDVRIEQDVLTIRAERKQERKEDQEDYHLVERSHGMFQRSLRLPSNVDADNVQARFRDGVLTITVPKTDGGQRSRRIQIQGSAGEQSKDQKDEPKQRRQPSNGGERPGQQPPA